MEANAQLKRPRSNTILYGSRSIINKAIDIWNSINRANPSVKFLEKSRAVCKSIIKKLFCKVEKNSWFFHSNTMQKQEFAFPLLSLS